MKTAIQTIIVFVILVISANIWPDQQTAKISWLISNVVLIDGTGADAKPGAVRVSAGVIVDIGDLEALDGEMVIDGGGQVLAPGFIDTHSHADMEIFDRPDALAAVSQGITTAIIGQDGGAPMPLKDFFSKLEQHPAAINMAAYAGHNTLRGKVMGRISAAPQQLRKSKPWVAF